MEEKILPLRPNVCILLFRRDLTLLLGERHGSPGLFQFPQGGIEEGTLEENILRELDEELSLTPPLVHIHRILGVTHDYDWELIPDYAKGRWRGQTQQFALVEFLGEDSDICVATPDPEFMSFRWCSADDVLNIAESKRILGYCKALGEAAEYFKSLKSS